MLERRWAAFLLWSIDRAEDTQECVHYFLLAVRPKKELFCALS